MRNEQIIDEAIDRFLRLRDGQNDASVRRELTAWLKRSPEHVRAYLEVAAMWVNVPQVRAERVGDAQTLIELAKAEDNVAELVPVANASALRPKRARRWPLAIAASVLVGSVAVGVAFWAEAHRTPAYRTDIGEQRTVTLTDGSTVELNSRSKVQVRFDGRERAVELVAGQALFRVAKDAARPFIVTSNAVKVQAVGTAFDIYRKKSATVVTVVEGRVTVSPLSATSRSMLSAGEQLTVAHAGKPVITEPASVSIAAATAWTQHQLVFESTALSEVVEEFNRYNSRRLIMRGDVAEDFRISAVFPSTDPGSLIEFLRAQPGLEVREGKEEILILGRK